MAATVLPLAVISLRIFYFKCKLSSPSSPLPCTCPMCPHLGNVTGTCPHLPCLTQGVITHVGHKDQD